MKITTVFLDRDGVLNVDKPDYILRVEDVHLYKDVATAIKQLSDAGIRIIVISNQAGIAKRLLNVETAEAIFEKVIHGAESGGGHISDYYYCPHKDKDACVCRKPRTGLFEQAVREYGLLLEETVFVGDGYGDAGAAHRLGIPFYLVDQGRGFETRKKCDAGGQLYIWVDNLQDAVQQILKTNKGNNK